MGWVFWVIVLAMGDFIMALIERGQPGYAVAMAIVGAVCIGALPYLHNFEFECDVCNDADLVALKIRNVRSVLDSARNSSTPGMKLVSADRLAKLKQEFREETDDWS